MCILKSGRVNRVAPACPVQRARDSTNWDRKDWPGAEIQMYYTAVRVEITRTALKILTLKKQNGVILYN